MFDLNLTCPSFPLLSLLVPFPVLKLTRNFLDLHRRQAWFRFRIAFSVFLVSDAASEGDLGMLGGGGGREEEEASVISFSPFDPFPIYHTKPRLTRAARWDV